MPPKQYCFKIKGFLKYEKDNTKNDFCFFMKALDDNHAVTLIREHLEKNAPKGQSIINGIEKIEE
jgi:hypothetical protein|tara:strand:- start:178 stop:372 length:195 start_codon:yes stop_codon:yes gene_type:complete